jgi:hypothetical protein
VDNNAGKTLKAVRSGLRESLAVTGKLLIKKEI